MRERRKFFEKIERGLYICAITHHKLMLGAGHFLSEHRRLDDFSLFVNIRHCPQLMTIVWPVCGVFVSKQALHEVIRIVISPAITGSKNISAESRIEQSISHLERDINIKAFVISCGGRAVRIKSRKGFVLRIGIWRLFRKLYVTICSIRLERVSNGWYFSSSLPRLMAIYTFIQ